jgi:hypothetical protein
MLMKHCHGVRRQLQQKASVKVKDLLHAAEPDVAHNQF